MSEKGKQTVHTKKTIAELSIDTSLLYDRLKALNPGEMVSYTELNGIIKRDVQRSGKNCLYSARKRALKHDQIITECVPNEGVKRPHDADVVNSDAPIKKIRRACERQIVTLACVSYSDLSPDDRTKHNTQASMLGFIRVGTLPSSVKKVERKVANVTERLPFYGVAKELAE